MEFDQAILRAVAGIEKKRSILQGREKAVVARHEVCGCSCVCVSHNTQPRVIVPYTISLPSINTCSTPHPPRLPYPHSTHTPHT